MVNGLSISYSDLSLCEFITLTKTSYSTDDSAVEAYKHILSVLSTLSTRMLSLTPLGFLH